ncbi:MAG: site-specific DNA-methyltransferase, partial [Bacteroidales bacterium]|nr:site-specific DNA-methyltransferase [Bacteroidales bacterium]
MEQSNEELQLRIRELEKEIAKLHTQIKKERYGLVWLDVPEGFERESENQIPVLEEVKDKAIKNDDGKPTHIIIEGDNYHALTCLNYTHKGKIDVIYIDPPYNTGSDGFTYKDKRFLKEFPDGSPVPKDHPLRHSYWLSFMSKRLELAKNLLSDKGVIFISIDDNEQANCKLLCDKIFGEDKFVAIFPWRKRTAKSDVPYGVSQDYEWGICYANKNFYAATQGKERKYYLTDDFPEKP